MMVLGLFLLGILVAGLGSMVGVGGGFILIPVLLSMFPNYSHENITAISLFAVAMNAISGSIVYFKLKKVQIKTALIILCGSAPGGALGVLMQKTVDRPTFEMIFGVAAMAIGVFLFLKKNKKAPADGSVVPTPATHLLIKAAALSLFAAGCTNFLGLGGGIVHVPLLHHVLHLPVHIATGTSHFILAVTTVIGTIVHFFQGHLTWNDPNTLSLVIGCFIGAQFGASLSKKISGVVILRVLGGLIFIAGLRLIVLKFI